MSDIIQLLPDSIANQIAAGEVIQRPASAVKELMENAIDAGGTEIKLVIKDAGKSLIQVIDDGSGMSHTDARLCFSRHATSKIRKVEDLFSIHTMGFRGEALASICAIAKVELKSRLRDEPLGTLIKIEGSEIKTHESCQAPHGTTISIKNLFYNVPARRNFLKSNPVETRHIIDEFQRIALAHPELKFQLINEGNDIYLLPAGKLKHRIVGLFGKNYNEKIYPVSEETELINIKGYIGKPENTRKTRGEQFLFVNKRFIKSPYIHHAIVNAYQKLIPEGNHPFYCLYLDIDPSRIDVNVHPTKQEIKFEDDRIVYSIMNAAVRRSLTQFGAAPSLDFDADNRFHQITGNSSGGSTNQYQSSPQEGKASFRPSRFNNPATATKDEKANIDNWKQAFEGLNTKLPDEESMIIPSKKTHQQTDEQDADDIFKSTQFDQPRTFQLHKKYIISSLQSGLMILNQAYAHQRVLYDRFLSQLENEKPLCQKLLFPQNIELNPADFALLGEILPALDALGFEIEHFGKNNIVVHGVPHDLKNMDSGSVILEVLENYKNEASGKNLTSRQKVAYALSKQLSIKSGKKLEEEEMRKLIDELFACKEPEVSPTGRKTFIRMNIESLDEAFND